jgi:hypothetical protein
MAKRMAAAEKTRERLRALIDGRLGQGLTARNWFVWRCSDYRGGAGGLSAQQAWARTLRARPRESPRAIATATGRGHLKIVEDGRVRGTAIARYG